MTSPEASTFERYSSTIAKADPVYQKFLRRLGTLVEEDHLLTGAFDHLAGVIRKHKRIVRYAFPNTDLIFIVPTLIEASENRRDFNTHSVRSETQHVVILWNARSMDSQNKKRPLLEKIFVDENYSHSQEEEKEMLASDLHFEAAAPGRPAIITITPMKHELFHIAFQ